MKAYFTSIVKYPSCFHTWYWLSKALNGIDLNTKFLVIWKEGTILIYTMGKIFVAEWNHLCIRHIFKLYFKTLKTVLQIEIYKQISFLCLTRNKKRNAKLILSLPANWGNSNIWTGLGFLHLQIRDTNRSLCYSTFMSGLNLTKQRNLPWEGNAVF